MISLLLFRGAHVSMRVNREIRRFVNETRVYLTC